MGQRWRRAQYRAAPVGAKQGWASDGGHRQVGGAEAGGGMAARRWVAVPRLWPAWARPMAWMVVG
jgi:hypothetical protein